MSMKRVVGIVLVSLVPLSRGMASEQVSTAGRFHAAQLILDGVRSSVSAFRYAQLDTSGFSDSVSPYSEFLGNLSAEVGDSNRLSDAQRSALTFFCTTGVANIRDLLMSVPNPLLIPSQPGDTPDRLKKAHANAFRFFEHQLSVTDLIPAVAGCTTLESLL